jgi:ABC-2 type transport system ATP-binding protein
VDVELRRDMWMLVRRLRDSGVTIVLTTHYIEEAEEMADRVGVIHKGELILVEEKAALMRKLGKKQLTLHLLEPLAALPSALAEWPLVLKNGGAEIEYSFDTHEERNGVAALLRTRSATASRPCCGGSTSSASPSRISRPGRARSRTSS